MLKSQQAGRDTGAQAGPIPLSVSGSEATRALTTITALIDSCSLIHSFNNHAMGTVTGPFRRAPAPVPEQPQPSGAALRFPHPSDAAARTPPRHALVSRIPAPASPAPERPRPPPSQPWVLGLRPASPRQTRRVRAEREARVRGGPTPGVQRRSAHATPGSRGLSGWIGPTGHSPPPGQNRGAFAKPFETAWAAAHPAVSSLFIGSRQTAHRSAIGPFEGTVGTRRPQP